MTRPEISPDEVKARLRLSEVVGQFVEWDRRKTVAARGDFWACCPFHQETTPSFHVVDDKGFFYCFGCHAKGDHFGFMQEIEGLDFRAALERLAAMAGIVAVAPAAPRRAPPPPPPAPRGRDQVARALEIWAEALPEHPILTAYLKARGVEVAAFFERDGRLPATLRFHPALPYFEPDQAGRWRETHRGPAMIGRIGARGRFVGIHRTWITPEGRQVVAGIKLDKRMLGKTGAIYGRPIRLSPPTARMVVGEGIETTLAVFSRLIARRGAEAWSAEAALTLGALGGAGDSAGRGPQSPSSGKLLPSALPDWNRPGWIPPPGVRELVILVDGSTKDPEAAARHAERARRRHAIAAGGNRRVVRLAVPGGAIADGRDFADLAAATSA